jgi:hypothetical protein
MSVINSTLIQVPRIRLRRFTCSAWDHILSHTALFELELDLATGVASVLQALRRHQQDHAGAFFVVTVIKPQLLQIEKLTDMPTNPMTGKPCGIRLDATKAVDEEGVVQALAEVTDSFATSLTHRAFRDFLGKRFEAHVLKSRRQWRRLGLDHAAMCTLARGMFEKSAGELEGQAVRALNRSMGTQIELCGD